FGHWTLGLGPPAAERHRVRSPQSVDLIFILNIVRRLRLFCLPLFPLLAAGRLFFLGRGLRVFGRRLFLRLGVFIDKVAHRRDVGLFILGQVVVGQLFELRELVLVLELFLEIVIEFVVKILFIEVVQFTGGPLAFGGRLQRFVARLEPVVAVILILAAAAA